MSGYYHHSLNLSLIGDSGVGKSNIMSRFTRNEFNLEFKSTKGIEFVTKILEIDNRIIKARIWDTAGQERYRPVTSCRCHNAKGVFIVYDITSRSSFENARRWLREIRKYADPNVVIMLVGNKADLSESSREVKTEEGRSLAEKERFLFIETSALDATNIDTAFNTLIGKLCSNMHEKPQVTPTNLPEKLQATPSQSITKERMQSRFPRIRGLFSRKEITEKEKEIFLDPFR
ncbi:hypothetical protein G6F18_012932 [Rhizopus arrhizus]|nr:hypothetical protein G6F18_012932 [Rhizopus arrhizus]KAG0822497.1 hypothetical protein G6F19_011337 [Rhizopus arrhizus]KAG0888726.1 hypothetical protein G6F34_012892 [Rhizopus arrhizus]KAG0906166.1 hypothetical protein G6F33_011592 [Rhizopus arrhizus]